MQEKTIKLVSSVDPSVNHYTNGFETRFVVRDSEEEGKQDIIIYLSSFKGCDQACRMCWLTQQGQTDMTPATQEDFLAQAELSLNEARAYVAKNAIRLGNIHYNFMARGEPFLNETVMNDWLRLAGALHTAAEKFILECNEEMVDHVNIEFKISTIIPPIYKYDSMGALVGGMHELPFKEFKPEIYYSLYSIDPDFRKRWLPKAENPETALMLLSRYRQAGGTARAHGAFIHGHNDDFTDIMDVIKVLKFNGLGKKFNIVRFNSFEPERYQESDEEHLGLIKQFFESRGFTVQMVERVGYDVAASCGMFIEPEKIATETEVKTDD